MRNLLSIIVIFGVVYNIIYNVDSNSFNFTSQQIGSMNYIEAYINFVYFSIVTFTTIGYGDIVPISIFAKSVVICEIIVFYIVIGIGITFITQGIFTNKKKIDILPVENPIKQNYNITRKNKAKEKIAKKKS